MIMNTHGTGQTITQQEFEEMAERALGLLSQQRILKEEVTAVVDSTPRTSESSSKYKFETIEDALHLEFLKQMQKEASASLLELGKEMLDAGVPKDVYIRSGEKAFRLFENVGVNGRQTTYQVTMADWESL